MAKADSTHVRLAFGVSPQFVNLLSPPQVPIFAKSFYDFNQNIVRYAETAMRQQTRQWPLQSGG